jgi:hypothetical protein
LASLVLERLHVDRLQLQQQPVFQFVPDEVAGFGSVAQARYAIENAQVLATRSRSHYVGTEHLLAALVVPDNAAESNATLILLEPFSVDRAAIDRELASLTACSLVWRLEFSPERGSEVFWRKLERDVFTWREATCVKLAASIRDDQAFDRLPILGDALEEAGCTDQGVLRHCRESVSKHAGWCWLLEELLNEPGG